MHKTPPGRRGKLASQDWAQRGPEVLRRDKMHRRELYPGAVTTRSCWLSHEAYQPTSPLTTTYPEGLLSHLLSLCYPCSISTDCMSLPTGWTLKPWLTGPGNNLEPLRRVSWTPAFLSSLREILSWIRSTVSLRGRFNSDPRKGEIDAQGKAPSYTSVVSGCGPKMAISWNLLRWYRAWQRL